MSGALGILNSLPEEKRVSAESVESRIGAAIFVDEHIFELHSEHAGNGSAVFGRDSDQNICTEAAKHIAKPDHRLRRQTVTASGEEHELVELGEVRVRAPFFVGKPFALRAVNFPLNATLVKVAEQDVEVGAEIQGLKGKRAALHEIRMEVFRAKERAKFDVLPMFEETRNVQPIHYFGKAPIIGEGLTMIREWE